MKNDFEGMKGIEEMLRELYRLSGSEPGPREAERSRSSRRWTRPSKPKLWLARRLRKMEVAR